MRSCDYVSMYNPATTSEISLTLQKSRSRTSPVIFSNAVSCQLPSSRIRALLMNVNDDARRSKEHIRGKRFN